MLEGIVRLCIGCIGSCVETLVGMRWCRRIEVNEDGTGVGNVAHVGKGANGVAVVLSIGAYLLGIVVSSVTGTSASDGRLYCNIGLTSGLESV